MFCDPDEAQKKRDFNEKEKNEIHSVLGYDTINRLANDARDE